MNEEELFCKLFPDYVYRGKPLSPYIDFFVTGYAQAENRCEELEKKNAELKEQIEKMKCCENCGWYYLQQHWRDSKEIDESRMFHCGTCGNKRNWKIKEIAKLPKKY